VYILVLQIRLKSEYQKMAPRDVPVCRFDWSISLQYPDSGCIYGSGENALMNSTCPNWITRRNTQIEERWKPRVVVINSLNFQRRPEQSQAIMAWLGGISCMLLGGKMDVGEEGTWTGSDRNCACDKLSKASLWLLLIFKGGLDKAPFQGPRTLLKRSKMSLHDHSEAPNCDLTILLSTLRYLVLLESAYSQSFNTS